MYALWMLDMFMYRHCLCPPVSIFFWKHTPSSHKRVGRKYWHLFENIFPFTENEDHKNVSSCLTGKFYWKYTKSKWAIFLDNTIMIPKRQRDASYFEYCLLLCLFWPNYNLLKIVFPVKFDWVLGIQDNDGRTDLTPQWKEQPRLQVMDIIYISRS